MSQRIRGQEATLQIILDGDLQGGSFTKCTNFNLNPRTELMETPFLGEDEDDIDIQHHGFDFDFELHNQDSRVYNMLTTIVSREQDHLPHPSVNIVVTMAFRSITEPALAFVIENAFIKLDSLGFGGRKEYVSAKVSGKCKTISSVA